MLLPLLHSHRRGARHRHRQLPVLLHLVAAHHLHVCVGSVVHLLEPLLHCGLPRTRHQRAVALQKLRDGCKVLFLCELVLSTHEAGDTVGLGEDARQAWRSRGVAGPRARMVGGPRAAARGFTCGGSCLEGGTE